jgi:hypothetical protein
MVEMEKVKFELTVAISVLVRKENRCDHDDN